MGDCMVTSLIYSASLFLSKSLWEADQGTQEDGFYLTLSEGCPITLKRKGELSQNSDSCKVKYKFSVKGKPL